MNILSSNVDYNKTYEFAEALEFGGMVSLIGMLAVFAVLTLILLLLSLFNTVFNKSGASEAKAEAPKPVAAPAPVVYPSADTELVAVIAAAISMAESEAGNGIKFRVVSFRKK